MKPENIGQLAQAARVLRREASQFEALINRYAEAAQSFGPTPEQAAGAMANITTKAGEVKAAYDTAKEIVVATEPIEE